MKENGPVVTAAGLIMASVFAGFILAPDPIVKQMGLSLTLGLLFDAFVVRMTIVPVVMTLMGKSAWYLPKWLDKILPNIDIEGDSIIKVEQNQSNQLKKQNKKFRCQAQHMDNCLYVGAWHFFKCHFLFILCSHTDLKLRM